MVNFLSVLWTQGSLNNSQWLYFSMANSYIRTNGDVFQKPKGYSRPYWYPNKRLTLSNKIQANNTVMVSSWLGLKKYTECSSPFTAGLQYVLFTKLNQREQIYHIMKAVKFRKRGEEKDHQQCCFLIIKKICDKSYLPWNSELACQSYATQERFFFLFII